MDIGASRAWRIQKVQLLFLFSDSFFSFIPSTDLLCIQTIGINIVFNVHHGFSYLGILKRHNYCDLVKHCVYRDA